MGNGEGGGGRSHGKQESFPWVSQQPYLRNLYASAQGLVQNPTQYYPGQTVAGRDPLSEQALGYTGDVIRGDYLNRNPFLDAQFGRAASRVSDRYQDAISGIMGRFDVAGRGGSPGQGRALSRSQDVLAENLSDLAAELYGQSYRQERGLQQQAAQFGERMGERRRGFSQEELQDLIDRWNFTWQGPYEDLARFSTLIGQPVQTSQGRQSSWDLNFGF